MNVRSRIALAMLAASTWMALPLAGADTSFGLSATVMLPSGDLKTFTGNSTGFGTGAYLLVDLGNGQTVRPRLDFISYPGVNGYFKMQQFSGGADYVYFTEGQTRKGLYLVAGAGIASNTYDTFEPLYSRSYTNPYVALGVGYQLSRTWGVEFRYNSSRYTDQNGTATSVNAAGVAVTVRF